MNGRFSADSFEQKPARIRMANPGDHRLRCRF